jgi:hypothetical protein
MSSIASGLVIEDPHELHFLHPSYQLTVGLFTLICPLRCASCNFTLLTGRQSYILLVLGSSSIEDCLRSFPDILIIETKKALKIPFHQT